jgi:hypothetical protein
MKMKVIIALMALPLLAIVSYLFFYPTTVNPQFTPQPEKKVTQPNPEKNSGSKTSKETVVKFLQNHSVEKSEDELTEHKFERAEEETKFDPTSMKVDESFLLKKYGDVFDRWQLSAAKRKEVIKIIGEANIGLAKAFSDYHVSWPVKVGHASNSKAEVEHGRSLVKKIGDLQQQAKSEFQQVAGAEFAEDFFKVVYPVKSEKDEQD